MTEGDDSSTQRDTVTAPNFASKLRRCRARAWSSSAIRTLSVSPSGPPRSASCIRRTELLRMCPVTSANPSHHSATAVRRGDSIHAHHGRPQSLIWRGTLSRRRFRPCPGSPDRADRTIPQSPCPGSWPPVLATGQHREHRIRQTGDSPPQRHWCLPCSTTPRGAAGSPRGAPASVA